MNGPAGSLLGIVIFLGVLGAATVATPLAVWLWDLHDRWLDRQLDDIGMCFPIRDVKAEARPAGKQERASHDHKIAG